MQKVNVITEKQEFHGAQRDDETIADYVSVLHEMLALCDFGNTEKAWSGNEHLPLEDKLTLDKAIQIAYQGELAVCTYWCGTKSKKLQQCGTETDKNAPDKFD